MQVCPRGCQNQFIPLDITLELQALLPDKEKPAAWPQCPRNTCTHTHSFPCNSHDLISIHDDLHTLIHTLWLCDAHWHTYTLRCTKAQELMRNNQFPHNSGQRASASRKAEIPACTALMNSNPSLPGRAGSSIGD